MNLTDKPIEKLNTAEQVQAEWVNDLNQAHVDVITEKLSNALDSLVEEFTFAGNEVIESIRPLALAVLKFGKEWYQFQEDLQKTGPERPTETGPNRMWMALGYCFTLRDKPPSYGQPMEPIKILEKQGLTIQQIAQTYEWKTPNGEYDLVKTREEMLKPGLHLKPGQRSPSAEKAIAEEWAEIENIRSEFGQRARTEAAKSVTPIAPESIEQLISQEVFIDQIMHMKQVSKEDVLAVAKAKGLNITTRPNLSSYRQPTALERTLETEAQIQSAGREYDSETASEIAEAHNQPPVTVAENDLDTTIWQHHEAGMKPKAIADALSYLQPNLTHQGVGKIIQRLKKSHASATS